jgi:L-2-hydroxyglutarate oxidase LhgO
LTFFIIAKYNNPVNSFLPEMKKAEMYDVLIIGCGVTGAACAYTLSKYALRIGILEARSDVAAGTTKGNSAIIHAGTTPRPAR